ncbi:hypothetical protein B4113_0107 [Geobacillus sp. B4113_201601]|nr:hypothetical protein B4113_0107 [Geobacillus sp. B4113_201601]
MFSKKADRGVFPASMDIHCRCGMFIETPWTTLCPPAKDENQRLVKGFLQKRSMGNVLPSIQG